MRDAKSILAFFAPLVRPCASLTATLNSLQHWAGNTVLRMTKFPLETADTFFRRRKLHCARKCRQAGEWGQFVCKQFAKWADHVSRRALPQPAVAGLSDQLARPRLADKPTSWEGWLQSWHRDAGSAWAASHTVG